MDIQLADSLTDAEVLGDSTFAEVACPTIFWRSGGYFAVGGDASNRRTPGDGARDHAVAVYRHGDMRCVARCFLPAAVTDLAFNPAHTHLAIGCGSYDGGYFYEGDLVVLDLLTGTSRTLLRWPRMVLDLTWDAEGIVAAFAPATDRTSEANGPHTIDRCALPNRLLMETKDWIDVRQLEVLDRRDADDDELRQRRGPVAGKRYTGHSAPGRSHMGAVRVLNDGSILAAGSGTRVERWDRDSGLRYRVASTGTGAAIALTGGSVVTDATELVQRRRGQRWMPVVEQRNLETGDLIDHAGHFLEEVCVIEGQGRDAFVIPRSFRGELGEGRRLLHIGRDGAADVTFSCPAGTCLEPATVKDSLYPMVIASRSQGTRPNAWFATIRGARNSPSAPCRVELTIPVDSPGKHRVAVQIVDAAGAALVDGGTVYEPGLLVRSHHMQPVRGDAGYVIRRSLPSGAPVWGRRIDSPVVDMAGDQSMVLVISADGRISALDTARGRVLDSRPVTVRGWNVYPVSIDVKGAWMAVGLADGRILRARTPRPSST